MLTLSIAHVIITKIDCFLTFVRRRVSAVIVLCSYVLSLIRAARLRRAEDEYKALSTAEVSEVSSIGVYRPHILARTHTF